MQKRWKKNQISVTYQIANAHLRLKELITAPLDKESALTQKNLLFVLSKS